MPIYVWKCAKCDAIVEELRKMGDTTPPESCGQCAGHVRPAGDHCPCGKGPCEFKQIIAPANFKIDPAAG